MKVEEAFSILGIPAGSDAAAIKKKYRELTKKYHPDINKEDGAEAKFKEINEAYQVASTGKSSDREPPPQPQWNPRGNPFNPFGRQVTYDAVPIYLSTTLNFKDSILGCKQELKFHRKTKCGSCKGEGQIHENNGCDKCGGRGQIIDRQGFMVSIQTCPKCFGRTKGRDCTDCHDGVVDAEATVTVSIPGGIETGNVLRLQGMGNFAGSFGPIDQHTDVLLNLNVVADPDLKLINGDVVCNLEISLLDALTGCVKSVRTILGNKDVTVQAKARNKDEVIIPNVGVNQKGNQRVILDIQYPDNVDQLIDVLSK